jgi:hypothetical protein
MSSYSTCDRENVRKYEDDEELLSLTEIEWPYIEFNERDRASRKYQENIIGRGMAPAQETETPDRAENNQTENEQAKRSNGRDMYRSRNECRDRREPDDEWRICF